MLCLQELQAQGNDVIPGLPRRPASLAYPEMAACGDIRVENAPDFALYRMPFKPNMIGEVFPWLPSAGHIPNMPRDFVVPAQLQELSSTIAVTGLSGLGLSLRVEG